MDSGHQLLTRADFAVIIVYVVTVLTIGFWVSFRRNHTDDLFLGGRSFGWGKIGLAIYATNVHPGMIIALASVAYSSGMVGSNFEWLAWLFLMLLAMVFLPHYLNTKISTMPEFMSVRYSESCRSFLSWYTLFSTLVAFIGGILYTGGVVLNQLLGWPLWTSIWFLLIIATSFTVTGGLAAVMVTDVFQAILMIAGSVALTVFAFLKIGSVERVFDSVPADFWVLFRPASDSTYPWHAILLGYPVMGIWFWCTDQTIVQRLLGARDLKQAQYGAVLAAFLKIGTPLIFFLPGIFCRVLFPNLDDPNHAYITMVTNCMPGYGTVGLIIAVLMAALISTIDAGLNSFSTVFTLDIYCKKFRPNADVKERILVGKIVTIVAALLSVIVAMGYAAVKGMDLFSLCQSILAFLAPPLAAVFIVGVLWPRANSTAAFCTLAVGSIINIAIGVCYLAEWLGPKEAWPHFLLLCFYMFAFDVLLMTVISLLTAPPPADRKLPTLRQASMHLEGYSAKPVWIWWAVLAAIMTTIYIIVN